MNPINALEPQILYQSAHWIVVAKPSGWLTIPGRDPSESQTLKAWVKEKCGDTWVVHRLDRETSGVVLFARTEEDHVLGNLWFRQRKVKKVYECFAEGAAQAPFFKITDPIEGLASTTQVEVVEKFNGCFFARVFPRTGRRHQIRIHLSKNGYPLLGDPAYGGKTRFLLSDGQVLSVDRVALHARSLEIPTGEKFECPLPTDFETWLGALRSSVSGA